MKSVKLLIVILLSVVFNACDKNDMKLVPEVDNGINIIIGENIFYDDEIAFYDQSSRLIYFNHPLDLNSYYLWGTKYWFTNNKEVFYEGLIDMSPYCSCDSIGVAMSFQDWRYPGYTLSFIPDHIFMHQYSDIIDLKESQEINDVFEQHGKLRKGLECTIDTILFQSGGDVSITFLIMNHDTVNYYYPDPGKMDQDTFHYLTWGLMFYYSNPNCKVIHNHIKLHSTNSFGELHESWLSKIEAGDTNMYTINYVGFDSLPAGKCLAYFPFPGMNDTNLSFDQLNYKDGWIWIGILDLVKEVVIVP